LNPGMEEMENPELRSMVTPIWNLEGLRIRRFLLFFS